MNYNGIDIVVSEETYNEYKETLEEQIKDLQIRIINAILYIENNKEHEYRNGNDNEFYLELNENKMNELLEILRGEE